MVDNYLNIFTTPKFFFQSKRSIQNRFSFVSDENVKLLKKMENSYV